MSLAKGKALHASSARLQLTTDAPLVTCRRRMTMHTRKYTVLSHSDVTFMQTLIVEAVPSNDRRRVIVQNEWAFAEFRAGGYI